MSRRRAAAPPDALAGVRGYRDREEHRIVGIMSGTSVDGVDTVLARLTGMGTQCTHEILAYRETPFEPRLRDEILHVAGCEQLPLERLMRLDASLGACYAGAVTDLLAAAGAAAGDIDAIGCHGQTIRHLPRDPGQRGALTFQIGSAPILAERTGITVVSDFRRRDAAAGGEGAPLVPIADWWLFRSDRETRVLLNLGGMANVTHLPKGCTPDEVSAFDTGPGNVVLDGLARLVSGGLLQRDENGQMASQGRASEALLSELLADPFFATEPPRSTGRERFGDRYASKMLELATAMGLNRDDVMATAVELTAGSVAMAVERFLVPRGAVDAVIVSGGGVHHPVLMAALERRLKPARFSSLSAFGVPPEAKEALAFAFLAHLTLSGLPGNLTGATGALHPVVLGSITPGPDPAVRA